MYITTLFLLTDGNEDGQFVSISSPLQVIENFLECLTNADKDGRIFINNQSKVMSFFAKIC